MEPLVACQSLYIRDSVFISSALRQAEVLVVVWLHISMAEEKLQA